MEGFQWYYCINKEEMKYVSTKVPKTIELFYAPMGTDVETWTYCWEPTVPCRLAFTEVWAVNKIKTV